MKSLSIAILCALAFVACDPQDTPLLDLSKVTVEDLQGALALATTADDKPAMQCYAGLIPIVQALPSQVPDLNLLTGKPITDFEKARLLAKKVQGINGGNDQLVQGVNLACGALYMDAKGDILRLMLKFRP